MPLTTAALLQVALTCCDSVEVKLKVEKSAVSEEKRTSSKGSCSVLAVYALQSPHCAPTVRPLKKYVLKVKLLGTLL